MTYILDTNIISYLMRDNKKVKQKAQRLELEGKRFLINGISYYEIKRGLLAANAIAQLKKFELLCKNYGLILLNAQNIFDTASEIYANLKQRGEPIEDADILIASTAICNDFILVSHDGHFDRIKNLKKEDWLS